MELTKQQIESKRAEYVAQKQQTQNDVNQAQVRLVMFDGAIQDCDYWLSQLESTEAPQPSE